MSLKNIKGYSLMKLLKFLIVCLVIFSASAHAEEAVVASDEQTSTVDVLWTKFKHNTSETWNNPTNYNIFIPTYAWHNRLTYDKKKIDKYNENPWGLGGGMSRYDADNDWHTLFVMAFKDSNKHLQTIGGYGYIKNWYFDDAEQWHAGLGFVLTLTQREEYSYIPLPLPLPAFSIGHKNIALQMAYVPGVKNDGNVAFFWTKVEF